MGDVLDNAKGGYRRTEVLTGPCGRRKWSDADKARIVAEAAQPGVVVSEIARRWQVTPQRVFDWRRQARKALAATMAGAEPAFVPIVPMAQLAAADAAAPACRSGARIEVRRKRSLGALLLRSGLNVLGQLRARRLEMAVWATFWTTRRAGIGVLRF